MSHATAIVITEESPTADTLNRLLAPYDENTQVEPYNEEPGIGEHSVTFHEGLDRLGVKWDDLRVLGPALIPSHKKQDFEQLVEDYWGHRDGLVWEDDRWVSKTTYNPASKWDWWVIGGRWRGFFLPTPEAKDNYDLTYVGPPGLGDNPPTPGHYDIIRKGDVDWGEMRVSDIARYTRYWTEAMTWINEGWRIARYVGEGERMESWHDWKVAETQDDGTPWPNGVEYQRENRAWRDLGWTWGIRLHYPEDKLIKPTLAENGDQYVDRRSAPTTHAVITPDGEWHEKGHMGWWAMVHDEKEDDHWLVEWSRLVLGAPDDHWLTLIDFHI